MAFTLPNPTTPTNGQPGDATPILQNEQAIAQAIAAFDGSQINSKSVVEAALADAINPRLRGSETYVNFVYSGCIWSSVSGLAGTMTAGTIYVNGYRTLVTGVGSQTFNASSDTYIDIDNLGNIVYLPVSNGATAPSLTANSIRVAKVVTSGAAITSVVQSGADGIGNIIYPAGPSSPVRMQNPYKFSAYRNAAQNTGNGAFAIVNFDVKNFDTGNNLDITTNVGRFTAPIAGFYHFDATVNIVGNSIDLLGALYKNGTVFAYGTRTDASTTGGVNEGVSINTLLQLAANDYIEVFTFCGTTHALDVGVSPQKTHFSGFLVSET